MKKPDIPPNGAGRPPKYPFSSMLKGESVFIAGQTTSGKAVAAARVLSKRRGWKVVARNVDGGVQVWRVE